MKFENLTTEQMEQMMDEMSVKNHQKKAKKERRERRSSELRLAEHRQGRKNKHEMRRAFSAF